MPNHKSDFKNLVNSLEKLIRSDDNEAKRILEENGVDPIKVGQKGENFVKELISGKLSVVKKQKHFIPEKWKSYSFRLEFRNRVIKLKVTVDGCETYLESGEPLEIVVKDKVIELK